MILSGSSSVRTIIDENINKDMKSNCFNRFLAYIIIVEDLKLFIDLVLLANKKLNEVIEVIRSYYCWTFSMIWFFSYVSFDQYDYIYIYIFNGKWGLSKIHKSNVGFFVLHYLVLSESTLAIITILAKTLNVVAICLIAAKLLVFFSHPFHFLFTRNFG